MPLSIYLRAAREAGWRITHWPRFLAVGSTAALSSILASFQKRWYACKIEETKLTGDPIFVIGHWRSGTTLLHELLIRDERFSYPTTYDCCTPLHHLVSRKWLAPMVAGLMPKKRPMDNMDFGLLHPQEDEFALCCLGNRSPYLTIMYPNRPPVYDAYLTLDGLSSKEIETWKRGLLYFVQSLAIRDPRPIVLKSPPHTARIRTLLEMFPKAKFVHIVRNPYSLFPSTCNLWKRLDQDYGLQFPKYQGLEEYVLSNMERMYAAFERDRPLIPQGQFAEVRYETFVKDQVNGMRQIYDALGLGQFDAVQPRLEAYVESHKNYRTNQFHALEPAIQEQIARRWHRYFELYGYEK